MSHLLTMIPQEYSLASLCEVLERARVDILVDVRMIPATPGFEGLDAFTLRPALMDRGMRYIYMGDCLGESSWPQEQRFQSALERVVHCTARYTTALFGAPSEVQPTESWTTLVKEFAAWDVELRRIALEVSGRIRHDEA